MTDEFEQRLRGQDEHGHALLVTSDTKPSELLRFINSHPGFKAYRSMRRGLRKVCISWIQYVDAERGIDESTTLPYPIYVAFPPPQSPSGKSEEDAWLHDDLWRQFRRRFRDTSEPVLTTDSADMQKGPQIACLTVGDALARIGIDIALQSVPGYEVTRNYSFNYRRHLRQVFGVDTRGRV